MQQLGVGKEVLSHCNKCKMTLAHLIVSMKSEQTIGKVECKTCKATHAYKDPSSVSASKTKSGKKSGSSTKTARAAGESISDIWMKALSKTDHKSQNYSPKTCFHVDDIIDHPKFGPGIVERVIDNDKIQVIFRHEVKTLIHNR
ncbi:MAG: hypothetical protein Fur0010_12120 [Bdellovibrio sp.]